MAEYLKFELSDAERLALLALVMPENELQGYAVYSVEMATAGVIYLYPDEAVELAKMARDAGLIDLAKRFHVG